MRRTIPLEQGANSVWPAGLGAALTRFSLVGVLLISLAARIWYVAINPLSYDETHNLMIGMLANQGYAPYREIYSVIAPFALLTMKASAALWGATPAVRSLLVLYGLVGIAAIYWVVRRQTEGLGAAGATLAATLAALFYSFNPHYFAVSTSINLEAGALAFALLSVAAVELFRTRPHLGWVFVSGACFGLSIAFKIFVPYLPGVVGLSLLITELVERGGSLRRWASWRRLLIQGAIWLAGVVIVVGFFLLVVDRNAYLEQVIASRFELREAIETDGGEVNIAEAVDPVDLLPYLPLALGALLGLVTLARLRLVQGWSWVAWLVLALLFLASHDPVRPRHTVTVLPALAALSGIGLGYSVRLLMQQPGRGPLAAGLAATAIVWAVALPLLLLLPVEHFVERHPARQAVIDYVRQATTPDDCIISKENRLHFLAGRLSTPYLSLISTARLFSGLLPAEAILADAAAHDCPVLVWAETFDRLVPALRQGASDHYSLKLDVRSPLEPDHLMEVFAVPMHTAQPAPQPADLLLGDQFRLHGWWMTPGPWQRGQLVHLASYWEALRPPEADYKIFVHLLDAQGNQVRAFDHYPFELREAYQVEDIHLNPRYLANGVELPGHYPASGMIPTRLWLPGNTLKETYSLTVPADLPPGLYTVQMGMYAEATMARLPVMAAPGEPDQGQVTMGTVEVQ